MAIITPADFPIIRENESGKKIVYCSGVFDLLHPGHILFFEDCRNYGDIVVVGVGGDKNIKERKNAGRPIMNVAMRLKMVDSLRAVDYCFTSGHTPVHHPQEFVEVIFQTLRPDVWVVNEDATQIPYRKELSEKYGVLLIVLPRWCPPEFDHISTTKLIEKIRSLPEELT